MTTRCSRETRLGRVLVGLQSLAPLKMFSPIMASPSRSSTRRETRATGFQTVRKTSRGDLSDHRVEIVGSNPIYRSPKAITDL